MVICYSGFHVSPNIYTFLLVVLDEFPEWLGRSIARIKETNNSLKKIAKEKKGNRLSMFQGNQKKDKKKSNTDEDDIAYGPRDCDIGILIKCVGQSMISI